MLITQHHRNVFEVVFKMERNKNWEQWVLLTSDRHWDNPKSDQQLQLEHLELAKERGAAIVDCGDFFCAMQGKWDKRSNKDAMRPEHQCGDYLDSLVDTAADFFEPYAHNFVVIASGNHEESIRLRHETSLIDRLCARLKDRTKAKIYHGGYSGFVVFGFDSGDRKGHQIRKRNPVILHYRHGSGGGGPVTADNIKHQRYQSYINADIICSGHTHDSWVREFATTQLNRTTFKPEHKITTHIKIASYKDDTNDGFSGWSARTDKPAKIIGAYWIRFHWSKKYEKVMYDVIAAR